MRISDWSSDVCSSDLGLSIVGADDHDGDIDARVGCRLANAFAPVVIILAHKAGGDARLADHIEALVLAQLVIEPRPEPVAQRVTEDDDIEFGLADTGLRNGWRHSRRHDGNR